MEIILKTHVFFARFVTYNIDRPIELCGLISSLLSDSNFITSTRFEFWLLTNICLLI